MPFASVVSVFRAYVGGGSGLGEEGEAGVCVFLRYSSFIRFPASPTLTTNVVETKAALLAFVIFSYIYIYIYI